jgi:hypothetical protein
MRQKGLATIWIIIIIILALLLAATAYYLGTQKAPSSTAQTTATVTVTPTPTQALQATPTSQESMTPQGWLTYTSDTHGFEISYPPDYEALDDANNLYGWSNGVVLIYGGGQSYDLPIEVWNSASEYQSKYPNADNLTIKKIGNKFITLLNMNKTQEVDEIITTFKEIN